MQRDRILRNPGGDSAKPEEVARPVFLCRIRSAYINGAVLNIKPGVYT